MERQCSSSTLGNIATSIRLFLSIFLLLSSAKAENKTNPTANQNLSPIQAWRSAEFCLEKTSSSCTKKYTLDDSGWLNVTHEDTQAFCQPGGCADHTREVLLCIAHVKRDFWFANKATVKDLNDTINNGCNSPQGFTGISIYPSHGFRLKSAPILTALSASALLLMALY